MKKAYFSILAVLLALGISAQSSFLVPAQNNYGAEDLFEGNLMSVFDVHDGMFYGSSGQTVHKYDLDSYVEQESYTNNQGYEGFVSFVSVIENGESILAGYTTTGNFDDRIYLIETATGSWMQIASFAANYDHETLGDHHLVSGLNSTSFTDPNSVFLLDISGNNEHRKLIEIGGYAAGIATDSEGNFYAVTSFYGDQNSVYRWANADVMAVIEDSGAAFLTLEDATKLTDMPAGGNDCEVDDFGNVIFNFNDFTGDKVMAVWNGIEGAGENYDALATAPDENDWLGTIKSMGTYNYWSPGNGVFTTSYGRPVARIRALDTSGIFDTQQLTQFEILPNPSTDFIRISSSEAVPTALKVHDLNGKLVAAFEDISQGQKIDIHSLKPGMYLIRSGNFSGKFIKK